MGREASSSAPFEVVDPRRLAHFRILGRLGRGGMGIVYRATDEKLQRTVALKVLPPGFETDPVRRARFLREARAAANVTHPNIAVVYEVGEADGQVYLAMEHIEGRTLRAMLAAGPLSIRNALRIGLQLARGLGSAHAAGVVHRDLKPENILVREDSFVKVLDFGLASEPSSPGEGADDPAVRARLLVGTPHYMSPEQARGLAVDARSDVFALGTVLYEMLCAVRPFEGASTLAILQAIAVEEPVPVVEHNRRVPAALARVVEKCLAKEPRDRYPDARAVLEDLSGVVSPSSASMRAAKPLGGPSAPGSPRPPSASPAPRKRDPEPARRVGRAFAWWPLALLVVLVAAALLGRRLLAP